MRLLIKNSNDIMNAQTSANAMASQMPSISKITGSRNTQINWNTSVLKNEIIADTAPLFNAVKKDDVKIFIPHKIKENAKILKACTVSENNSAS